jgi:thiamine biosynthesis lipoprotein
VNAGGDLFVFGTAQPVHIRHPEDPNLKFPLGRILNSAVASSSGCFSDREKIHGVNDPLIDPRRNRRVNWRFSVTVIASRCIVADALTKIVRLAPRQAKRILHSCNAQAVIADRRHVHVFQTEESKKAAIISDRRARLRPQSMFARVVDTLDF